MKNRISKDRKTQGFSSRGGGGGGKKSNKKWEEVPLNDDIFTNKEFENLISLEVLTDYTIEKKPAKKIAPSTVTTSEATNEPKKRKLKDPSVQPKKKKVVVETTELDDDEDLSYNNNLDEDDQEEKPHSSSSNELGRSASELSDEDDENQGSGVINFAEKMPAWVKLGVPNVILQALYEQGFENPTSIQSLTLQPAIFGKKDIVGAAETGSGKTLAFALPILAGLLELNAGRTESSPDNGLQALILTPTRELAVQIKRHIEAAAKHTNIQVVVIMGGLAPQKQERLLRKNPEIVIATPGRLWELVNEGNEYLSNLSSVKYLVIDETDRMVEKGHFQELEGILAAMNSDPESKQMRQNFVFSATLSFTHEPPERLKKTSLKTKKNKQQPKKISSKEKLRQMMDLVGVRENAKIVDITSGKGTCETLTEMQITCQLPHKDYYLYYFFLRFPGRTIIFCNSINCVRRLTNLFFLLKCEPLPLHSEMQQKQRLRNLERFAANDNGILIATDVAARGLDIVDINHVIHYQVPKSAESYIHRSGRTARAFKGGLAVLLIEPTEIGLAANIARSLGRTDDLPTFQVDAEIFREMKARVDQAVKVEAFEHTVRRKLADMNWMDKAKKEMDLASSEDDTDDEEYQRGSTGVKTNLLKAKKELESCKKKLDDLLSMNLFSQKRGTDVPTTLKKIADLKVKSGVNAAIAKPQKQKNQQIKKLVKNKNKAK